MKFDLHMHSCFSKDGEFTPKQLIQIAKEKEMKVIALCDHDSVQGVTSIIEEGKKEDILVIPSIECTTLFNDYECHLLGYNIDINHPYFQNLRTHINEVVGGIFHKRFMKMTQKYHLEFDEEEIVKEAGEGNPWFTFCYKLFADPRYENIEDFKEYRKGGKRCDPAPVNFYWDNCQAGSDLHVRVEYPSFKESVKMIHEAGGLAVLAHPFKNFYQREDFLQEALDAGIDGIEVYSNYHEQKHIEYYKEFAIKNNLMITCGSDFHGKTKPNIQMGSYGLNENGDPIIQNFLDHIKW